MDLHVDFVLYYRFIENYYVPFIFKPWSKAFIILLFSGWLCSSLVVIPQLEIGLDQEITMPDDSHVLKYFSFLKSYLSVGPPVYFVINNTNHQIDFANQTIQNRICENLTFIHILLQSPLDFNTRDEEGWTPMHYACDNSKVEMMSLLLNNLQRKQINFHALSCKCFQCSVLTK